MAIQLNHTIVAARDKNSAATFLTEILGLPAPSLIGPFAVVRVSDDDTSLDYVDADGEITSQHYAFLVEENEFERIRERRLTYWADPGRRERDQINTWDGGRGVYFDDPNGHLLEIITRPYGNGGTTASRPHPLFAGLDREDHRSPPVWSSREERWGKPRRRATKELNDALETAPIWIYETGRENRTG